MSVTMTEAITAVRSLLDARKWNYTFHEKDNVLQCSMTLSRTRLKSLNFLLFFNPSGDDPSVCRYITSLAWPDMKTDENCMAQVGEYLHLANRTLNQGHLNLDYDRGQVTFHHALVLADGLPTETAITGLLGLASGTFNAYGDGLLAVTMGLRTPLEAWQAAQKK